MSIRFIEGRFMIHNLNIKTENELNSFVEKIKNCIKNIHPNLEYESDVEIDDEIEIAGKFDE